MRLTASWVPITVFRNLTKPSILSLTPSTSIKTRHYNNSRASQEVSCACQGSKWRNNLQTTNLNLWKLVNQSHSAAAIILQHRRQFSNTIPALTTTTSQQEFSSNNSVPENDKKPHRRTLDQVVYHLQADLRRRSRVHRADMHNAIELVEKASRMEDFGTFLLNCCCDILPDLQPAYRVKLGERIWAVIQKDQDYSSGHFEAMLKTLAVNEDNSLDPFKFLEEAKSSGVKATGTMYYFAMLTVCQRGDLEAAVKILSMMKDDLVPVNERFFNALMIGNLRAGDLKGATDLLDIMRASQITPSIYTWFTLLHVYIETENLEGLQKTHAEIIDSQLTEDQFYDLLKAAGRRNKADIFHLIIRWAKESRKMHWPSLMNLSVQLLHLGHPDNALKIILQFAEILRMKKEPLGTFFIKEATNALTKDPEKYITVVSSLQHENRNPYALNTAAESCLKHKKFNLAFQVIKNMLSMDVSVRPHYFLPALIAEMEDGGTLGGIKVLKEMKSLDVLPDWEMLIDWIIPMLFREEGNLLEVLKIVQDSTGLSYSSDGLLSAGLIVALLERKIEEVAKIVEKLKGKVFYPERVMENLHMYICDMEENETKDLGAVMKYIKYVSANKPVHDQRDHIGAFIIRLLEVDRREEAELLVADIVKSQIKVSQSAAETLKEKLKLEEEMEVDGDLFHEQYYNKRRIIDVKEMDLPELESHKVELESKGMNARGTSRKLFIKYCASENIEKVLEHKISFEKNFGTISRGMKSALMGAYVRNGELESALELFQELTDVSEDVSDVVIDVYKIIDLATLMVKKGRVEDAIELIQEKCPSRRVQRPENISRNIVRLLEAISNSNADYVYDLTQLFLKLRFIKPTNPTLAPSIKDLVRRNNLEGAVERLEHYSEKYRVSPCVQELTYSVLDKPELLERVIKCSTFTKGKAVAMRLLALARADMGDIDGAAKDFIELGNDLNFDSIVRQCEYLSSKNEIVKLLNLIKSLIKTGRNYDCTQLYDIAVQGCKRSGNKEGLKEIFSDMEEQDLYISPKLKQLLVKSV